MSAATSRVKGFKRAISPGPSTVDGQVNAANNNGITPLIRAACDGSEQVVRSLIDRGADVNARRKDGFTPLLLASFYGHRKIVRLLLDHGADVEIKSRFETGAEMWADARGFFAIGDELRKAKTTTDQPVTEQDRIRSRFTAAAGDAPAAEPKRLNHIPKAVEAPALSEVKNKVIEEETVREEPPQKRHQESAPNRTKKQVIDDSWDVVLPAYEKAPEFHAASVFVSRITDSWRSLALFTLVTMLLVGGVTVGFLKLRDRLNATAPPPAEIPEANPPIDPARAPEVAASDASNAVEPAVVSEANEGQVRGNHAPSKTELLNPPLRQSDVKPRNTSARVSRRRSDTANQRFQRTASDRGEAAAVISDSANGEKTTDSDLRSTVQPKPIRSAERPVASPSKTSHNQSDPAGMIAPTKASPKSKVIQWP